MKRLVGRAERAAPPEPGASRAGASSPFKSVVEVLALLGVESWGLEGTEKSPSVFLEKVKPRLFSFLFSSDV